MQRKISGSSFQAKSPCPCFLICSLQAFSLDSHVPGPESINTILSQKAERPVSAANCVQYHHHHLLLLLCVNKVNHKPQWDDMSITSPSDMERGQTLRCASVKLSITNWHRTRRKFKTLQQTQTRPFNQPGHCFPSAPNYSLRALHSDTAAKRRSSFTVAA